MNACRDSISGRHAHDMPARPAQARVGGGGLWTMMYCTYTSSFHPISATTQKLVVAIYHLRSLPLSSLPETVLSTGVPDQYSFNQRLGLLTGSKAGLEINWSRRENAGNYSSSVPLLTIQAFPNESIQAPTPHCDAAKKARGSKQ